MASDPSYEVDFDPSGDNDWLRMRREIEEWGVDRATHRHKRSLRVAIEDGVADVIQTQLEEADADSLDEETYVWIAYELVANIGLDEFQRFREETETELTEEPSNLALVVNTLVQTVGERVIDEFDQPQLRELAEQVATEGPSEDAQALRQSLSEEPSIPEQRFWKEEQRKIAEKRRGAVKHLFSSELDQALLSALDEDALDTLAGRTLELLEEEWETLERSAGQGIESTSPHEFVEETEILTARRAIESVGWDAVEEIAENLVERERSQETTLESYHRHHVRNIAWRVIRRLVMEDLIPRAPKPISVTGTGLEPVAEHVFLDVRNGEIFVDLADDAIIYDSLTFKIAETVEERTLQPISPDRVTFIYDFDMQQSTSRFRTGQHTNR